MKAAFGASLYEQGRGYYVALELLALVWGTSNRGEDPCVLPAKDEAGSLRIKIRSHDFARRLAADSLPASEAARVFDGGLAGDAATTVQALVKALAVDTPGRRSARNFGATHLYPYVGNLIHHDAVERQNRDGTVRVQMERYLYRGGGGLAHRLLREDGDLDRLSRTRSGLARLVAPSPGALGALASALTESDQASPREFDDSLEPGSLGPTHPSSRWAEHLRRGVVNILGWELHRSKKIEALMHWVPYAIARYQLERACSVCGRAEPAIPVDLGSMSSSIRDSSRATLDTCRGVIFSALEHKAVELGFEQLLHQRQQKWRESSRGFFTGSLAVVGGLNALSGKRHFCLRVGLLEAITLAALKPQQEVPFKHFARMLFEEFGLVIDADAAAASPELARVNRAEFQDNAAALCGGLRHLGMLREYSDATRMVGVNT